MGFFSKLLSGSEESSANIWHSINSDEDLTQAIEASRENPVAIFKHSTRCFISKTVLQNFEAEIKSYQGDAKFYFLDLLKYRQISNKIAEDFGVTHQSPQLIVIKDGKVVNHASHNNISISLVP
ncbi:bacillithiol system redox-active protein YtxJ [Cruoricaptor ignavus]|uniref:Bacillithiol system redox-active protein YtxJ n=1 Tax=Cruoricaptor ignavus TaxID=1118202 RepID=A0A7M1T2Z3_9FLAO|nr:bacillithiol system redox-active protein YtxJ [Cruoricaptor ignavus]QOR74195.1 bacillithiol system redox-active protein YtxJ [Cruoricaptor ignavus]